MYDYILMVLVVQPAKKLLLLYIWPCAKYMYSITASGKIVPCSSEIKQCIDICLPTDGNQMANNVFGVQTKSQ